MLHLMLKIQTALNNESGQDLIEYALIAALIAVACVAAMGTLAGDIANVFSTVGGSL